jgi:hypothetical protein
VRAAGGEEWPAERGAAGLDAVRVYFDPTPGTLQVRISSLPAEVPAVLECLVARPEAAWLDGAGFVGQVGVGTSVARLPGVGARALRALAAGLAARGARLDIELAPPGFPPPAAAVAEPALADLLDRTKSALDPEGRFPSLPLAGGAA